MLVLRRHWLLIALRAYAGHSRISAACCVFSDHAEIEGGTDEAKNDTELGTHAADAPRSKRYGGPRLEGCD